MLTKKNNLPQKHKRPNERERDARYGRYTPANICSVGASVAGVILSQHSPNLAKKRKNKGDGGGKHTQKVILWTKTPLFVLQYPPTSPLSIPPPNHPNFTLCAPQQRCTPHQDNNHSKQGRQRPNGGGQKFFFPPTQRFWDLSRYNRLNVIQHCSVFSLCLFCKKKTCTSFCFNTPSFSFSFLSVFFWVFGFFWTTSFTFFFLCSFLCIP